MNMLQQRNSGDAQKAMKIALLLSGLPRQWNPSLGTQLNMLADHEVGVFFHFWDTIDASEKSQILELLKPLAYIFEAPKDFSSFDHDPSILIDNINVPSRMASQYYSWKCVGEIFTPYADQFDFVVRARSDLQFVSSISHIFSQLKSGDVVIPWWDKEKKLLTDIFAIGDPKSMLYYHKLYDRLPEYKGESFNPEWLLMHHLLQSPIPLNVLTEENQPWYFIRRPHMQDMSLEECMKENPGRNKWLNPEVLQSSKDFYSNTSGRNAESFDSFITDQLEKLRAEKGKL
ncbi:MAG: hypothetical protein WAO98_08280 [Alphaproteobacteria bacterium]